MSEPKDTNEAACGGSALTAELGNALKQYHECGGDDEKDPLERLRFFCSLAMRGQDWLDVEPFFDAVKANMVPNAD